MTDKEARTASNNDSDKPEPLASLCIRLARGDYSRAMMMVYMIANAEAEHAAKPHRRLH